MKQKLVIVINGKGGAGKDTLCESVRSKYPIRNVSAITPIKEIAAQHGWQGEKTPRARRFLAELKRVFVEYNDLPNRYLLEQYEEFEKDDNRLMFVHIREADQIAHFAETLPVPCVTLLVRRSLEGEYGNHADDDVENYPYDCYFDNSGPLEESVPKFLALIDSLVQDS